MFFHNRTVADFNYWARTSKHPILRNLQNEEAGWSAGINRNAVREISGPVERIRCQARPVGQWQGDVCGSEDVIGSVRQTVGAADGDIAAAQGDAAHPRPGH